MQNQNKGQLMTLAAVGCFLVSRKTMHLVDSQHLRIKGTHS